MDTTVSRSNYGECDRWEIKGLFWPYLHADDPQNVIGPSIKQNYVNGGITKGKLYTYSNMTSNREMDRWE